jgi:hypothetical protein
VTRINWLTEAELVAVEAQVELVQREFEKVLNVINHQRVPAKVLDRWLKVERALHSFRVNGVDEMRRSSR